jgi:hypothetical protein
MHVGVGECHEAFAHVFGPIFQQLHAYQQQPLSLHVNSTSNSCAPLPPLASLPSILQPLDNIRGISVFGNHVQVDASNTFVSPSCRRCKLICRNHKIETKQHNTCSTSCRPFTQPPTSCDVFASADIPAIRTLISAQESSACFHFCPFCLATHDDIPAGKVHAPITLHKYSTHHEPNIKHQFNPRTNNSQYNHLQSFVHQGHNNISKASSHGNVIHPCLISTPIHDHLSPVPLHVRLGTTKKALDLIQQQCLQLDNQINKAKGNYNYYY